MKAAVCTQFGEIEQLEIQQIDDPKVSKGAVLLKVLAAGVNFPDGLTVQGLYQHKPELPFVPGVELAGEILEIGEGVKGFAIGDRVLGFSQTGAFAEQSVVPAATLMPIPEGISNAEASGFMTAHATAHYALRQRGNLQAGETLLVTGAAGGTGLAAVQIGKAIGATVIAACSTAEKLAVAKQNGADILINYSEKDLKTELKAVTDGKGVDVAYDVVGGEAFDAISRCMAWGGRLLVIGFASGTIPKLPVNLTLVKSYSVIGVFWGAFTQREPQVFAANMQELVGWYMQGKVKVHVDETFPLERTVDALNKVMHRQVTGKVVITPHA
ncbi:MAG: NADPH:quinone oxidoreductase family protein [Gammaproteobacteria bacterium]|nr:NADPH:quinone oxidoreductase family protein [Gammaproteobacteria bacterium]